MIKYVHQLKDVTYNYKKTRSYKKGRGSIYTKSCNDILTFDVEVTSAWIDENGEIIGYRTGESNEYWNSLQPLALCYLWQFSFNDKVYYGRELKEFLKVLDDLPKEINFIIWVHNLSYEFHFLNNIMKWKTVFAKEPHKPMKCVPEDYPNIEFRCSYMLTRLSLDSWGKQIGFEKATGDLDYEKIRTPKTKLTDKELNYGERDCLVVYEGIKQYRERYGSVRGIPLTQTGTVRQVVKDMLMSDKEYVKFIKTLVPKDAKEYERLINVFAGGYTHANRFYSNKTIKGLIEHYDFASSYPTVMIAEKYPCSPWEYVSKQKIKSFIGLEKTFDDFAYILTIKFTNIECKTCNTYIQASKCTGHGMTFDNGRIISAEELTLTCTEQDYLTIAESYTYDTAEFISVYRSYKDYLPKPFIEYILELYHNKTTLKDVEGMEDLYMQSKQYINSLFGMSVTAIIQKDVKFDGQEWFLKPLTEEDVNKKLEKLTHWSEREKRYFLSYSWGCWVTAYARRNLWKCILSCDEDVIYCDTDSIFVIDEHDFSWYNKEINAKLKATCDTLDIDFERTRPKTIKGKAKPLGIFDKEDNCIEFRTLGAKRYVERREKDNQLHLTVSGINKGAVALLKDDIENFVDGFNFDKDDPSVSKRLSTYLTDMPKVKYPDGYVSKYKEGINMRRTGYLLTLTDDYLKILEMTNIRVNQISESGFKKIRSTWRKNNG